jgi:hypothetical protein
LCREQTEPSEERKDPSVLSILQSYGENESFINAYMLGAMRMISFTGDCGVSSQLQCKSALVPRSEKLTPEAFCIRSPLLLFYLIFCIISN